jgi:uridine kinase
LIEDDISNVRLICVAGPSSSGKTTFANRLRIELLSRGIRPIRISIDDYYKKSCDIPNGEDGKPDFEAIDALDIDYFNQNMLDLINGEPTDLPKFDFPKATASSAAGSSWGLRSRSSSKASTPSMTN